MFEQLKLDYAFNALEPYIDALTMETHYTKHHAAYTKNLNSLAEAANIAGEPIERILAGLKSKSGEIPGATGIRNNGGGFFNHNLYFGQLGPASGGEPAGLLAGKINEAFGSFASFKEQISKAAMGQFGSGWAWLNRNDEGQLSISASPNQDNPIYETQGVLQPVLGIDVWEHAYYLKYKNLRADYVKALFEVVDWKKVEHRYNNPFNFGQ